MQIAQRVLLIVAAFFTLMISMTAINLKKEEKLQNQWEGMQTELFLNRICRRMGISEEEYINFITSLNYNGAVSKIVIEEYRREEDLEGRGYYFLISWNELQKLLVEEGNCRFEEESVIRIIVDRQNKDVRNVYYGIVSGEE